VNSFRPHPIYGNQPQATTFLHSTSPVRITPSLTRALLTEMPKRAAGLFSSLVSQLVTARFVYPRLVSKLVQFDKPGSPGVIHKFSSSLSSAAKSSARSPATEAAAAATPTILPSLGASGAIYSTVIISTLAFPDAEVSLVFPPTPSFPIEYGVGGLVLLDCIGVLRGWRYAHTNL
jgi:rhomboid-like protein